MSAFELESRLRVALDLARQGGAVIARAFCPGGIRFEHKHDGTPVTEIDRAVEQLYRERLARAFPLDGVLGEELGEHPGTSGYRWIVDPIDGTTPFIHGVPLFGTLIGLQHRGVNVLGVVHLPMLRETVYAHAGGGAWHVYADGQPVRARVSGVTELAGATLVVTSPSAVERLNAAGYATLSRAVKASRGWGDCVGHMLVATGRAEIMIDTPMHLWDVCVLEPIVTEAGGTITDWRGHAPGDGSGGAISTNGSLHGAVVSMLG